MTAVSYAENLGQQKGKFSMIVVKILAFAWSSNIIAGVKNLSPNFKEIAWQCFTLSNVIIQIVRSILSVNFKQLDQKNILKWLVYSWYNFPFLINKPDIYFFPDVLVLFWWIVDKFL